MKTAKKIGIVVLFLAFSIVYAVLTTNNSEPVENQNEQKIVKFPMEQLASAEKIKVSKDSKTEILEREIQKEKEAAGRAEYIIKEKNPERLTSTFKSIYTSPLEKQLNERKSETPEPVYYGNSGKGTASDFSLVSLPENNASVLPVKKGSVPVNRKVELTKPEVKQADKDFNPMDYFNLTENSSNSTAGVAQESTVVKAAVMGNHEVKSGGIIRFRLMEDAVFKGKKFARNTVFFGKASFANDRLFVVVDRLPLDKGFEQVALQLHDQDLMEGIYAPTKEVKEAATDETFDEVSGVLSSTGNAMGIIGSGVARIFRTANNGSPKIAISDAYPVFFILKEN